MSILHLLSSLHSTFSLEEKYRDAALWVALSCQAGSDELKCIPVTMIEQQIVTSIILVTNKEYLKRTV